MKSIIDRAASRGHADHGWLKTSHTFSFADYYNPDRMHFGALRVLNDDYVAPGEGFGLHPHKNMEVVSIPLQGELKHGDSIGNSSVITPGQIQVMSAGKGIYHSEYNASATETLNFLQIWVYPQQQNTTPWYADFNIKDLLVPNQFAPIISPDGESPARIDQNAWFAMGNIEKKRGAVYQLHSPANGVYVFVIEGKITANAIPLSKRDGAGIYETNQINVQVEEDAQVLLIEVPML